METPCTATSNCPSPGLYSGFFVLDRSALEHDGTVTTTPLAFRFALGGTVWDSTTPSDFAGYRGGGTLDGWTLRVANGDLTGLCCGVFGAADFPFLDLLGGPPSDEGKLMRVLAWAEGRVDRFTGDGTFSWSRVPEPATMALFATGLLLLWWTNRRLPRKAARLPR